MADSASIRAEIEKCRLKKKELSGRLKELEAGEPKNFHEIWTTRDRLAYWEGKIEGLQFSLNALET